MGGHTGRAPSGVPVALQGIVDLVTRYYARTTRGIEWVAAAEVTGSLGAHVELVGHRELLFTADVPPRDVLSLRTVDDVFVHVATLPGVERSRASLAALAKFRPQPVLAALDAVASMRAVARQEPFVVTASALGKRNYNRFEIEEVVGRRLSSITGACFHPRSADAAPVETEISWRVHVRDSAAILALRLGRTASHRRAYRQSTMTGSLHPPVASALALVGGVVPGRVVLDPFCGAGTIVLEHVALAPAGTAIGADIDRVAVDAAVENARRSTHRPTGFVLADASHLPLATGAADLVVTNPPWSRRVSFSGEARDERSLWQEVVRVVRPTGRLVVLSEKPPVLPAEWRAFDLGWVAVSGSKPRLVVYARTGHDAGPPPGGYLSSELRRWWPDEPPGKKP